MPGTYISPAETGLYYLQSRYYNPVAGRFINADRYASTGQGILGYNMFAYCGNNPINMNDERGNLPQFIKTAVKWVAQNVGRPIVKTAQKALSKVHATYSTGINISGTPSIFTFNLQIGISIDTTGNVAIQSSAGSGFTGGSPSLSITAYRSITNAPSIDNLNGLGYQIGGSVGIPVDGVPLAVGGDFNMILDDPNKPYLGVTTNVGLGTPGGEFHVEWGSTTTVDAVKFNLFDVAWDIYTKIME